MWLPLCRVSFSRAARPMCQAVRMQGVSQRSLNCFYSSISSSRVTWRLSQLVCPGLPTNTAAQRMPGTSHGFAAGRPRVNKPPRLTPSPAVRETLTAGAETFYSSKHDSFEGLEVSPSIQLALQAAGVGRPSKVQELSAPNILRGRNVVVTAETGSGKTLAYLVPVVHLIMKQKAAAQREQEVAAAQPDDADAPKASPPRRYHALVLCPNNTLCQQVVAATHAMRGEDGKPLVTAAHINSSNPPPFDVPDIVVATPAGLLTLLNAGSAYGWLYTEEGMQARVRHVILDEADLLLGDAFSKATQQVLVMFKVGDRRRVEAKLFEELGFADKSEFDRLPRPLQQAAWRGGVPAMLAEGYKPKRALDPAAKYGPYWRRQYIYSAATMPTITYSDVGSQIQKMHPDAVWVSTELLHQSKPQVEHTWHEVTEDSFGPTLLEAIRTDPDYQGRRGKTLVFVADGASADSISQVLAGGHVSHVVYHKSRPRGDQEAALEVLRNQEGAVMVCTDAAARGLDVMGIKHVVQAHFAANAINFIHRIGRTARAGQSGRVTSLYQAHNRPLVEVIRNYIAEGIPLEAAFSRARSFSKKLKRTGGVFVPRGVTPQSPGAERPGTSEDVEPMTADLRG